MNAFNRLLLIVVGVAGLLAVSVLTASAYRIPFVSDSILGWSAEPWYIYTILSISGFLGLIFIILLLTGVFAKPPEKYMKIKTGIGDIDISRKSIESVALKSIRSIEGVRSPEVHAKLHGRKETVSVHVDCHIFDQSGLPTIGKSMQEQIKVQIESLLEVPVKKVSINIQDPRKTTKSQSPRVI
ncbi:alkaline shock response membrane anchor protein AmaP [Jeotgalibacillus aurantiacus]|uniref:alkaline shock response membrane anchor protein AmaP n=1 Tax=Jeotgalibacillus aurantiacus TaxID=2763266 RepID=UPI001D09EB41|nr:alkaline shock response membrane anchor protein AmaP [Jeotgalibacillus aurantiacus]